MYDSVNLWYPAKYGFNQKEINTIGQCLTTSDSYTNSFGQLIINGHLKNYKVRISEKGVSCKGSLAKYFLSDNFQTLNKSDSKRALEKLSDELHISMFLAELKRVDFAQNYIMNHPPETYYNSLGDSQHYQRLIQPKSLYYSNTKRTKLFYNKIAEGKSKGELLPAIWKGKNILRYELRFLNRLSKQFAKSELIASKLFDDRFYISIFDRWYNEYKEITKLNKFNFNTKNMNSPKDFWKQLELLAIHTIGKDKIMDEIENLRRQNAFDKPEYYSRIKKDVKAILSSSKHTEQDELITELDKKIKASKTHYR